MTNILDKKICLVYYDDDWYKNKSVKGKIMPKQESFQKAVGTVKTAGFKAGVKKLNVVNFAEEFKKRDIDIVNSGLEK